MVANKRNAISNDQKREICQYKKDNPLAKNQEVISHFEKRFSRHFCKSSISEILQNSSLYLVNFNSRNDFRIKKAKYPELEDALYMWYCDKINSSASVNDEILKEKAQYFGSKLYGLNRSDFKYSNGWLKNFKKRFNINFDKMHAETVENEKDLLERQRIEHYVENYLKLETSQVIDENLNDEEIDTTKSECNNGVNIEERKLDVKKYSHEEAEASYECLFNYLENSPEFSEKDLECLLALKDKLDLIKSVKLVQKTL
jgi:hypothetical protein